MHVDPTAPDDAANPASSVARIERAMRAMKRVGDAQRVQRRLQRMTGVDLDASAFVALMRIAETGPVRLTDLARELWLDLSVVSRKVRQLEDRGFVERAPDPDDARAARVTVTDGGRAIASRVASGRHELLQNLFTKWSAEEAELFAGLFERFVEDITVTIENEVTAR